MAMALDQLPPVSCSGCGACCTDVGLPPYTAMELFGIPARLRVWWIKQLTALTETPRGKRCIALRNGLCRIYMWRPAVCVNFKIGSDACLMYRRKEGVAQ